MSRTLNWPKQELVICKLKFLPLLIVVFNLLSTIGFNFVDPKTLSTVMYPVNLFVIIIYFVIFQLQ